MTRFLTAFHGAAVGLFGLLAVILPWLVTSNFWLGFFTIMLFFALLAHSWNILGGYCGQWSFGHAAFFGMGAYSCAVLQVQVGLPALVAAGSAVVIGAMVGAFIGSLAFRYGLRGAYFALVTLAFAEVFRVLVNSTQFTGSGFGILIPLELGAVHLQFQNRIWFYYIILALVGIATGLSWWFGRSRFGAYMIAVRENESAADALGINVFRIKLVAMTISAMLGALAGVFYVQYFLFIDSSLAFGPAMSVNALLAPIIGGLGTIFGPLIGAAVIAALGESTKSLVEESSGINLVLYGVILLIILRFAPNGIVGMIRRASAFVGARLRGGLRD